MEYIFLVCKQNVGAGISILIPIPDGSAPSIFCQKMEGTRPKREEMNARVVHFPPESAFPFRCCHFLGIFFAIFTLTWRVSTYVSRREQVLIKEMKVHKTQGK